MAILFFFFVFTASHFNSSFAQPTYHNVLRYGAKPNGVTDSTNALLDAWVAACGSKGSSKIYVPKGRYLVGPMDFRGTCKSPDITFQIDGTLVAPRDYHSLGQAGNWLSFYGVDGVSVLGGALDAKGAHLWDCKAQGSDCPAGASTLSFTNSRNIKIKGLFSLNSQMFHIVFNGCNNVNVERIKVKAPGNSPNTDGIHVQFSTDVVIMNSSIKTGDDCISIGPGTKNLWIEGIQCGPGHGISIGSLAQKMDEEGVQNVTVKRTSFKNTSNGFRIKSWARPSNGYVERVRFKHAIMHNVQNPIIIDQRYCPHNLNCPNEASSIKINNVIYRRIRGTSATTVAIKFDCSSKYPCSKIRLYNVNLVHPNETAQSSCVNVLGETMGIVRPNGCL